MWTKMCLEILYERQVRRSTLMKNALSFIIRTFFSKRNRRATREPWSTAFSKIRDQIIFYHKERVRNGATLAFPRKQVKRKSENANRGQRKAHVRRDQNARSNNSPKKGKGKGQWSRSPTPRRNGANTANLNKQNIRTGKTPSGKGDRPCCFDWKNGACSRGRDCDYWHPLHCRHFKSYQ